MFENVNTVYYECVFTQNGNYEARRRRMCVTNSSTNG